jgi:hypothetical protein
MYRVLMLILGITPLINCANVSDPPKQCSGKVRILGENTDVFRPGTFGVIRSISGSETTAIGLRISRLQDSDILSNYGIDVGDQLYKVCGVSFEKVLNGGVDIPICCGDDYPNVLTIEGLKADRKPFSINVPRT